MMERTNPALVAGALALAERGIPVDEAMQFLVDVYEAARAWEESRLRRHLNDYPS